MSVVVTVHGIHSRARAESRCYERSLAAVPAATTIMIGPGYLTLLIMSSRRAGDVDPGSA